MAKVFIKQAAAFTSLGENLDDTFDALCLGKTAIAPVKRFSTVHMEGTDAAIIPSLDMSDSNKIITLLSKLLPQLNDLSPDTFVIWTGIKGGVEQIERQAGGLARLSEKWASDYRKWIAEVLSLNGTGMEINAACVSSTVGISVGAELIERGQCRSVLVVGADWVSRFTFSGFASLRALTKTVCRPFDINRDGLAIGEAAAAVHLTDRQGSGENLPELIGSGIANDANHITGPSRDGAGLTSAIHAALKQASLSPVDIGAFCAHGTATRYNDDMELTALERVFDKRRFPVFSVKGALGHTLGAAGVLETAICLKALSLHTIPPTCGCKNPEQRASDRAGDYKQEFKGCNILTTNSGFGGINAALIIRAPE
ncbi:MAG: beta-ketoacyl-[acyl-carrier-protein] synthase family protein [Nitrospirae bacterium YQR-1]